jgi:hypothetical protein
VGASGRGGGAGRPVRPTGRLRRYVFPPDPPYPVERRQPSLPPDAGWEERYEAAVEAENRFLDGSALAPVPGTVPPGRGRRRARGLPHRPTRRLTRPGQRRPSVRCTPAPVARNGGETGDVLADPARLEAADRANQDVPPWPGDETVEEHPAAWATIEGAHLGAWGALAGAVIGGAVVLSRRLRR